MIIQGVSLLTFQSAIQLAAAINLALSAFSTIRISAQRRYDAEEKRIDIKMKRAMDSLEEGDRLALSRTRNIDSDRSKFREEMNKGTQEIKEIATKQKKQLENMEEEAIVSDGYIFFAAILFSLLSIFFLFLSSTLPLEYNIAEKEVDKYRIINNSSWWFYAYSLPILYLPMMMSIVKGIGDKIKIDNMRKNMSRKYNEIVSRILAI